MASIVNHLAERADADIVNGAKVTALEMAAGPEAGDGDSGLLGTPVAGAAAFSLSKGGARTRRAFRRLARTSCSRRRRARTGARRARAARPRCPPSGSCSLRATAATAASPALRRLLRREARRPPGSAPSAGPRYEHRAPAHAAPQPDPCSLPRRRADVPRAPGARAGRRRARAARGRGRGAGPGRRDPLVALLPGALCHRPDWPAVACRAPLRGPASSRRSRTTWCAS